MNKIIFNELHKVTATSLIFDENSTVISIPKTLKILNTSLKKGQIYKIKLAEFITNPYSSSTLASNWNNGQIPKYDTYLVEVLDSMANMIKVNGVAVSDPSSRFFGWLPYDGFEVLSKEE